MNDFNTLLTMMGQGQENPELCGQKVPTVDQVLSSAKSGWRTSVQTVAQESRAFKIPVPEVRLPTREEVTKATCAAVSLPFMCESR